MNNCSYPNGTCTPTGTCQCNAGFGLDDCSATGINIESSLNMTLLPRETQFVSVSLNGNDVIVINY
jgi:hypothetical protein